MTFDPTNPAGLYILDEHGNPKPEPDVLKWGAWYEQNRERVVASDRDEGPNGLEIHVSTVFLGMDHRFVGEGPPILWETLVFGGVLDGEMDRYSSREAAAKGHQDMCRRVRETLDPLYGPTNDAGPDPSKAPGSA